MAFVFLDKISTSAHLPKPASNHESWRHTLIQPVAVPNLAHTGIRSSFTFTGEPVLRPDGSVSNLLRRHIRDINKNLPKDPRGGCVDVNDMANRDKVRRSTKAKRIEKKASVRRTKSRAGLIEGGEGGEEGSVFEESSLNETQLSAMSKIIDRRPTSPERQKKPFSDDSLFTALLESQVGGNGDRWDLADMGLN